MSRLRRVVLAGAILVLFTAYASSHAAPAQAAGTNAVANVKVQNLLSRLCLTPAGSSGSLNATIVQYFCQADPARSYTVYWNDSLHGYQIWNLKNDLCLSPAGGSVALNVVIVQYTCDSDQSRLWNVVKKSGTWLLQNAKSGLCLSPAGGSTGLNAAIVQYTCDGNAARTWDLFTPEFFQNRNTGGLCATVAGGSATLNTVAVTYTCDGEPARLWKLVPTTIPGTIQLQNVSTGLCLSPAGGRFAAHVPVVEYYCDGQTARLWSIGGDGTGLFNISNNSGLCLGAANNGTGLNNTLEINDCWLDPSHTWSVYIA